MHLDSQSGHEFPRKVLEYKVHVNRHFEWTKVPRYSSIEYPSMMLLFFCSLESFVDLNLVILVFFASGPLVRHSNFWKAV